MVPTGTIFSLLLLIFCCKRASGRGKNGLAETCGSCRLLDGSCEKEAVGRTAGA